MKLKLYSLLMCFLLLGIVPSVQSSPTASTTINMTAGITNSQPTVTMVFRGVYTSTALTTPVNHTGNYAFTGDVLYYQVDVRDNDGNQDILSVEGYVGGNPEVGCAQVSVINSLTKRYNCLLSVEPPTSMQGQYPITVVAIDKAGNIGQMVSTETWWLNPFISLSIQGNINFPQGTSGQTVTTQPITVSNNAQGGVTMKLKISGKDMSAPSGYALCPTSNILALSNVKYYASMGAYNTGGYLGINYENGNPANRANVLPTQPLIMPGSDMTMNFRLTYPTPCVGTFSGGMIYLWGEAI